MCTYKTAISPWLAINYWSFFSGSSQPAQCRSREGEDNGRKPRGPSALPIIGSIEMWSAWGRGIVRGGSGASPDVGKRAVPPALRHYLHWLCIKLNSPALTIIQLSHIMSALSFIGEINFSGWCLVTDARCLISLFLTTAGLWLVCDTQVIIFG